jgi:hypothetical protein
MDGTAVTLDGALTLWGFASPRTFRKQVLALIPDVVIGHKGREARKNDSSFTLLS